MAISALDLFKIGVGPSSSHTMGPMRAGALFRTQLLASPVVDDVARVRVDLYGSLAATGLGHGTDRAVVAGLLGFQPQRVDPDEMKAAVDAVVHGDGLMFKERRLPFDWSTDLLFHRESKPWHPNALTVTTLGDDGADLMTNTFYSIGGGFVVDEAQAEAGETGVADVTVEFPFSTSEELLALCSLHDLNVAELVARNELAWRPAEETGAALLEIWSAMRGCIERGVLQEGFLPGGLRVPRRAPDLYRHLISRDDAPNLITRTFSAMDWVNLYALAVNEENAAGGCVVTAPTNGAAGIIPAVLQYYMKFQAGARDEDVVDFLLAATAVGVLLKMNASISGAEVGCQGEVGSACAMAAAGLAQVMGGSPAQVENAAEIGLEHNLGLTCDPIGGLVQVPCIERNAMASVKAINAAQLALNGDGRHRVTLDQAIRTMRDTGRDMLSKYKETSEGGLAVAFIEC
ncbi:L-serine ammonia-lyase [Tessaracoccus sp. MC1865]|uniref:L-serine ammonia-lyase n=1 Tax=Tessaracoccus sp. MC1865 TaxID=2760310 RepID=UPI001602605B|nr:L-serine ammonia-lyase [Tessaracoccus sp. MC1865]MBB1482925.1 L-serine ammonia-lyase [Tessaracoccus sp. MC1865]QTO37636.1 L-serine ammonia-lyase [Tessaracoccus sp. MC1865]